MNKVGDKYIIILMATCEAGYSGRIYSDVRCYVTELVSISPKLGKLKFNPPLPKNYYAKIPINDLQGARNRILSLQQHNKEFVKKVIEEKFLDNYYLNMLGIKPRAVTVDKIYAVLEEEFGFEKSLSKKIEDCLASITPTCV